MSFANSIRLPCLFRTHDHHVYVIDLENGFIWNIIRFLRISEYVVVKIKEKGRRRWNKPASVDIGGPAMIS